MESLLPAELVEKAREVIEKNRTAGRRIAVAESCTGGLVSAALTEIAGSSDVFEAGYVTYSNEAKRAPSVSQKTWSIPSVPSVSPRPGPWPRARSTAQVRTWR